MLLPIFSALVVALPQASPARAQGHSVARTTRADTTVVTTTGPGALGANLRPVEVLRIAGDTPESTFGQVGILAVLADGGVLLIDSKSLDGLIVRHFDANGKFVRNIGRRGEGPGEFTRTNMSVSVGKDGVIVLRDADRAVHRFAPDGKLLNTFMLNHGSGSTNEVLAADDGSIWVRAPFRGQPDNRTMRPLQHWSRDGKLLDSIVDTGWWTSGAFDPNLMRRWWQLTADGRMLHSRGDVFGYLITDPAKRRAPQLVQAVRAPLRVAPEYRAEQEGQRNFLLDSCPPSPGRPTERIRVPETLSPSLGEATMDGRGRVWVRTRAPAVRSVPRGTGSCGGVNFRTRTFTSYYQEPPAYAIFAPDGALLGEVVFPVRARVSIGTDVVWAVLPGEDDVPEVVKYRVPGLVR